MRLRLLLLLGALVAATIAVSPSQAASAAGCASAKPAAAGTPKPSYKKPGNVLAKGKRYAIVMNTTCGTLRIALAGSQFFVISGVEGANVPPAYGLLGHAADKASLATIRRIAALATLACGQPQGCPPSRNVWIVGARLVTLP